MGTDIHGVVQTRSHNSSRPWTNEIEIDDDRSYIRFAVLADVNNYSNVTPIAAPRGLPHDCGVVDGDVQMTFGSRGSVWLGDHSHSWLTPKEILNWNGWDQKVDGTPLRDLCENFIRWVKWVDVRYVWQDVRIVFGFDS